MVAEEEVAEEEVAAEEVVEEEEPPDQVAVLAALGAEELVPPDQVAASVPRPGLAFPVPRPRVQVAARLVVMAVLVISGWVIGPA